MQQSEELFNLKCVYNSWNNYLTGRTESILNLEWKIVVGFRFSSMTERIDGSGGVGNETAARKAFRGKILNLMNAER